jgi:4-alpha-glucanotransferase
LRFAHDLGFSALQLGPQGAVSRDNASPYDGTAFSRNPLSIALHELVQPAAEGGLELLDCERVERRLSACPGTERTQHRFAFDAQRELLGEAYARFEAHRGAGLATTPAQHASQRLDAELSAFRREHAAWLLPDGLYDALSRGYACDFADWGRLPMGQLDATLWQAPRFAADARAAARMQSTTTAAQWLAGPLDPPRRRRFEALCGLHAPDLSRYAFTQLLVHRQHRALLRLAHELDLELYGDLPTGYARHDTWHFGGLFLEGYRMGAPPSRTNPDGQPWGYPVLDPGQYRLAEGARGPALQLVALRAGKALAEYDRLRLDHPHGLVCPWVYRSDISDPLVAVQRGARLFSSPDLQDHPQLARYSLVMPSDLDRSHLRHADDWVRDLSELQVEAFSRCLEVIAQLVKPDEPARRLLCEVLSTQPHELGRVMQRYELGRFRVTQKASLDDASDVYRTENARPEDWVLLGNHDTPPIWQVVERWQRLGQIPARADHLASRLGRDAAHRETLAKRFRENASALVHGQLAELFIAGAKGVLIAFTDLFGFRDPYNVPGNVSDDNWSLRIARDFSAEYARRRREGRALCLQTALRLALDKRCPGSALLDETLAPVQSER